MKNITYILFLLFAFLLLPFNLQTQSITWQRTYNGPLGQDDIGYSSCKADGDNFFLAGYVNNQPNLQHIIKINKFGDFSKSLITSDANLSLT